METLRRTASLLIVLALAACAQSNALVPSASTPASAPVFLQPNDSGSALPGDSGSALPGAKLPCHFPELSKPQGTASCTIAIDVNVPPNANPTTPSSLLSGLHPADVASAYELPVSNAGQTVAVIDAYDDPNAESDLGVYRSAFGLPACTSANGCFRKVNKNGRTGSYPIPDAAWAQEIAVDVDMVSAVCPKCKILLVEANSASIANLGASVDTAVALGAKVVSNSYYALEWPGETAEDAHYRHAGIPVTVSAGDQAQTYYPAASPYVAAIGATTLRHGTTAWTETPWKYGGRGCSAYEKRPAFQAGAPCSKRAVVDVAAVGDPQTGVTVFSTLSGGWVVAGGTSVGAPIVAAAYALAGNARPLAYSYAHRGNFNDVPPAGYDLPTGIGSPKGVGGL